MVRLLSIGIACVSAAVFIIPAVVVLHFFVLCQRSFWRFAMVLLFAFYGLAVFSVTGLPTAGTLRFDWNVNFVPLIDIVNSPAEYVKNTVLNICLFVPLGFLLPIMWSRYRSAKKVALVGFAMSVVIEALQLFTFRFTDVDDLITNTFGAVLGYGIAKIVTARLPVSVSSRIAEQEGTGFGKYEPALILGMVFLIGFFLKPLVVNVLWEMVLKGELWERIK